MVLKILANYHQKAILKLKPIDEPHCKIEDLLELNEGLIVLSGGVKDFFGGLYRLNKINDLEKIILSIHEKFKDRFYLEIQRHNDEHENDFENFLLKISLKKNSHNCISGSVLPKKRYG